MNSVLSNKKIIAFFILPTMIIYTVFVLIPIGYNVYLSLYHTDLISKNWFIGFRNYTNLLNDKIFLQSLKNNGLLVLGSLIAHLPLALFFGNMIFKKIKGSRFFQSVFFLPAVISGAGVGLLFNMIYNSEFGLVNALLKAVNLENWQHAWLSEKSTVMIALIVVVMWKYVGYHMVIQLAAMKSIPSSLYQAAEIDGATSFQQFTKITLPLIKHVLKIDTVLIITGSLKYFDLIWSMTKGGPNHASEVLATYMYYQGFRTMKFGYASAIGVILLVLCFLVIWIVNHIIKTEKISY